MRVLKKHSFYSQAMFLIGAALTLVTLAVSLLSLSYQYRGVEWELRQRLDNLIQIQAGPIAGALWTLNRDKAQEIIESLQAEADFVSAVVVDEQGRTFATFTVAQKVPEEMLIRSGADIVVAVDDALKQIGKLTVAFSRVRLIEKRDKLILFTLVFGLIQLLAVLAATALALRSITRPLTRITQAMLRLAKDDLQGPLPKLDRNDQLGEMARAVEIFQANALEKLRLQEEEAKRIDELLQARQAAEAASRAKSTFLANVSHEMRTPLNAIVGLSEVMMNRLSEQPLPHAFDDNLHYIHLSAQHLAELINNILDLSRIEAGKMELASTRTKLKEVIDHVFVIYKTQADQKGVLLTCECDPCLPRNIFIDAGKLKQVLINLISNAIKFTPSGKRIDLSFGVDGEQLVFRVADQGIGIPEDRLPLIFEDFEQVDSTITRDYGGSGLGLAITQKILTLFDGTIAVESIIGEGTTFTVRIPFKQHTAPPSIPMFAKPTKPTFAENSLILIVEDNPVNQITMEALLEDSGLAIQFAENGEIGVRKALELKPDLIFMDLHMPIMSGLEATRLIRQHPGFETIPIIALSADALTEQQAEAFASGVSGYLTKPINSVQLLAVLQEHLQPV